MISLKVTSLDYFKLVEAGLKEEAKKIHFSHETVFSCP